MNIIEWTSETKIVRYVSPLDGKNHRYFIDFSYITNTGQEVWIEIKPYAQTQLPRTPKRKTKQYVDSVQTYLVNQAKWNATEELLQEQRKQGKNISFVKITEKDCPWFIK
jgi:ABC-type taurine transport system substrate-binding protein